MDRLACRCAHGAGVGGGVTKQGRKTIFLMTKLGLLVSAAPEEAVVALK